MNGQGLLIGCAAAFRKAVGSGSFSARCGTKTLDCLIDGHALGGDLAYGAPSGSLAHGRRRALPDPRGALGRDLGIGRPPERHCPARDRGGTCRPRHLRKARCCEPSPQTSRHRAEKNGSDRPGRDREDISVAYAKWRKEMPSMDAGRLVFIDESGFDTKMTRRFGRSFRGVPCFGAAPHAH